jgi:hypothetical protein
MAKRNCGFADRGNDRKDAHGRGVTPLCCESRLTTCKAFNSGSFDCIGLRIGYASLGPYTCWRELAIVGARRAAVGTLRYRVINGFGDMGLGCQLELSNGEQIRQG